MSPFNTRLPGILILAFSLILPAVASAGATSNAWDMPPLNLSDLKDHPRDLSDWKGKVILLNFWATWCPPCQKEMPYLVDLQRKYGDQDLQIVSIGLDEKRKLKNFARTVGINFPVLVGHPRYDLKLLPIWGNRSGALPFSVVIASDGHMKFMRVGEFDQEAFDVYVKPLLTDSSATPAD